MAARQSRDEFIEALNQVLAALEGDFSALALRLAEEIYGVKGESATKTRMAQHRFHAFAWMQTYVVALRQSLLASEALQSEADWLMFEIGASEYLSQLRSGIAMSQGEYARYSDFSVSTPSPGAVMSDTASRLMVHGADPERRASLANLLAHGEDFAGGVDGADMAAVREQFRRFADDRIAPFAHRWHERDELIPIQTISELAGLGVFGVTTPEAYGGLGMGALAMCVISEELSRGYIGAGSLGTRAEIAGALIAANGTEEQKSYWLPRLASGDVLPTAVFTEPGAGSDLASLRTRAQKVEGGYRLYGAKTWITHGARSDLMTLLARTDPASTDHRGLTMFLAEKTRGGDGAPFPDAGIAGGEIKVLGYRGMKEYEIAFDGFFVSARNVLGGVEGQGFKQLMRTFESARIQTAARAIGVARNAFDLAVRYAVERRQFGERLLAFPRIADKIALMASEIRMAQHLTYFAARRKDDGDRCDIEAGMAKLLAARTAWSAADNALQIHGGNGYSNEYEISRVFCDARILSIFEGAAEIQAQVIAKGLLEAAR
ncbi:MAG TPA: acyl-CoA dehydrogenase family protein [Parvularculaceae bacterium]|nr:acyl-CoA dehydrogenase family protein [Amphiplicatus sp.]HPE30173.1 acyl-CoA dehydrogenase family protein [Parvularculaceae bacterium]